MKKMLGSFVASFLLVTAFMFGGAFVVAPAALAEKADCNEESLSENPLQNAVNCSQPDGTPPSLFGDGGIFTTVTNILIFIVGIIAVVMLIIGGIRYAVSGGDQSAVTSAKNTILYAIIGLIVAFLAFAIVNFVTTQLKQGTEGSAAVTKFLS